MPGHQTGAWLPSTQTKGEATPFSEPSPSLPDAFILGSFGEMLEVKWVLSSSKPGHGWGHRRTSQTSSRAFLVLCLWAADKSISWEGVLEVHENSLEGNNFFH